MVLKVSGRYSHQEASAHEAKYKLERQNQLKDVEWYPSFISLPNSLQGRIKAIRSAGKKLVFVDLEREQKSVQVILNAKNMDVNVLGDLKSKMQVGDIYEFSGEFGESKSGQYSLMASTGKLLAPCLRQIPLELKSIYTRHKYPYLDMLVNQSAVETVLKRSKLVTYVRLYLTNLGFNEVETPILSSQAGGAIAKPFKTELQTLRMPLFLRIAPELYLKQLVIGGIDKVFEIGKQFRNEGIDATHNPEFTTCEMYQSYCTLEDMMQFTQQFMRDVFMHSKNSLTTNVTMGEVQVTIDVGSDFAVYDVSTELEKYFGTLPDLNDPKSIPILQQLMESKGIHHSGPKTLSKLVDTCISEIIEPKCVQPSFIVGHPSSMSPLAKAKDGKCERFELFIGGKEYVNAYVELNDPAEQLERFKSQNRDRESGDVEAHSIDTQFCEALEYGMPPTVGWGLGIDRLCMLLFETPTIRDVLTFPLMKPE